MHTAVIVWEFIDNTERIEQEVKQKIEIVCKSIQVFSKVVTIRDYNFKGKSKIDSQFS